MSDTQIPTNDTPEVTAADAGVETQTPETAATETPTTETFDATKATWTEVLKHETEKANTETANVVVSANTATSNTAATVDDEGIPFRSEGERTDWQKRQDRFTEKVKTAHAAELFGANGSYAWANGVSQEDGQTAIAVYRQVNANPLEFFDRTITGLVQADPQNHAILQKWALGLLGLDESVFETGAPAKPAAVPQKGSVPIVDENNKVVGYSYTAEEVQAIAADLARKEVDKALSPINAERQDAANRAKAQRTVEEKTASYAKDTDAAMAELKTLPGFEANKTEIGKWVADHYNPNETPYALLSRAYHAVAGAKLREEAARAYAATQKQKAGAGTISPTTGAAGQPFDATKASWSDVLKHEVEKAGRQEVAI